MKRATYCKGVDVILYKPIIVIRFTMKEERMKQIYVHFDFTIKFFDSVP